MTVPYIRDRQIVDLALQSVPPAEIAERLEIANICTVYSAITRARKSGTDIPHFKRRSERPCETLSRTVAIPRDVLDQFTPSAAARGVTVNHLVRDLLAAIADDELVDAILDDDR